MDTFRSAYILPFELIILLVLIALGFVVYILWRRVRVMEERYDALVEGTEGGSLEEVLNQHLESVRSAVASAAEAEAMVRRLAEEGRTHLQYCGIVRFNPFSNTGGDQSFCIALADAMGRGVVITSLHAREGTRVYAKPLTGWESPYPLTDEERAAIQQAFNRQEPVASA
ncbi:MAG: DUF4446 family protein [Chloroflexi bacterium]|nr:DUF4446 family protein [Chloroflexota bacterium]